MQYDHHNQIWFYFENSNSQLFMLLCCSWTCVFCYLSFYDQTIQNQVMSEKFLSEFDTRLKFHNHYHQVEANFKVEPCPAVLVSCMWFALTEIREDITSNQHPVAQHWCSLGPTLK